MAIYFTQPQRLAGDIGFVSHYGDRQICWQTGDKVRPDICGVGRVGGGAVDHKQHAVGLLNFLPGTLDTDTFNFIVGVAQTGGIDNMQWHTVNVNMLAQHVAGGASDVSDNSRFTARQGVQQARFPGVRTTGNHYLHPFAQQAALTRFGTYSVEIAHHGIQLRFDFAIGEEIYLLVREVDSRLNVNAQVGEGFHKVVNTR